MGHESRGSFALLVPPVFRGQESFVYGRQRSKRFMFCFAGRLPRTRTSVRFQYIAYVHHAVMPFQLCTLLSSIEELNEMLFYFLSLVAFVFLIAELKQLEPTVRRSPCN